MPTAMVSSVRRLDPDATIIQCSDLNSPAIAGVDKTARFNLKIDRIMHARLQAFSELGLKSPALYLDTDMLLLKKINISELFQNEVDAIVCRRSFQKDLIFNHKMRGLDFSEYASQTLDQVFPYIACSTITRNNEFWEDCKYALELLKDNYHQWYGDQEAIKIVIESKRLKVTTLPERIIGCLPESLKDNPDAHIVHFKGPSRKLEFSAWCSKLGLEI